MAKKYKIQNNYGKSIGFTPNTGYLMQYASMTFSTTSGTFSIAPEADFTYYEQVLPLTGNLNVSINATNSTVYSEITILFQGGSATYSVGIYGDGSSNQLTSVSPNKYAIYKGTYNGYKFIGNTNNNTL